jgi:hypothetical protein
MLGSARFCRDVPTISDFGLRISGRQRGKGPRCLNLSLLGAVTRNVIQLVKALNSSRVEKQTAQCCQGIALKHCAVVLTRCLTLVPTRNSQVYESESNWTMKPTSTKRSEIKQRRSSLTHHVRPQSQKILRINRYREYSHVRCKCSCIEER